MSAQGPARAAGLLPGGKCERVFDQARKRAERDWRARHGPQTVQVFVRRRERLLVQAQDRQVHKGGALVSSERVRLVRPVQVAERTGVAVEVMLGLFVIPHHAFKLLDVVHAGQTSYPNWL